MLLINGGSVFKTFRATEVTILWLESAVNTSKCLVMCAVSLKFRTNLTKFSHCNTHRFR